MSHPVTLITTLARVEGTLLAFVVCDRCGARWSGPYGERGVAEAVTLLMNTDADAVNPRPLRSMVCCASDEPDEPDEPVEADLDLDVEVNRGEVGSSSRRSFVGTAEGVLGRALVIPFLLVVGIKSLVLALFRPVTWYLLGALLLASLLMSALTPSVPVLLRAVVPVLVVIGVVAAVLGWAIGWRKIMGRVVDEKPADSDTQAPGRTTQGPVVLPVSEYSEAPPRRRRILH